MQRPDEAELLAGDVLKSDRGNGAAARVLGQALLMQGRALEAINPLERAARRTPDPVIETLLGRALAEAGRTGEALDRLRQASSRRPAYPLAFVELGDQLGKLGRFDEALPVFETGLALSPDAQVLRMALGYLHMNRNDRSKARALFLAVRAAAPERHDARLALAQVLALDGDHAAAAELYRGALALRPDDAATRIALAKCLLEMGERDAGEAALRAVARDNCGDGGPGHRRPGRRVPHGRAFLRPSAAAKFLGAPRPEAPRPGSASDRRLSPRPMSPSTPCTRPASSSVRVVALSRPRLAADREALRHRRAPGQHACEPGVMPMRREVDEGVGVAVAVHQAGERRERQVEAVGRVGCG